MANFDFPNKWYALEHDGARYWMWSPGDNEFSIHNPHSQSLRVQLAFNITVVGARRVALSLNGTEIWHASLADEKTASVNVLNLVLAAGGNQFELITDSPGLITGQDTRMLAYNLGNLEVHLMGTAP